MEAIRAGKILQKHQAIDPVVISALQEALNKGSEHNRLEGHDSWVMSVSFSPDGQTLATGSEDKTIKLWNLNTAWDLDSLMGCSCDWVGNYLQYNPNVSESDKHLCDGIGTQK